MSEFPLDNDGMPEGQRLQAGLEMSPRQAAEALRDEDFVLIDVRETDELAVAAIPGAVHIPLGQLKTRVHEIDADEDTPIGVLCHHGRRSFQATVYLQQEGLSGARSVAGGIELWSQTVDPSIPRY